MKTIRISSVILVLFLCIGIISCEDKNDEISYTKGYIIGTFVCGKENSEGMVKGATPRGYCIVLENNKQELDTYPPQINFYTFDNLKDAFNLPEDIMVDECDSNNCGPIFFPKNLRKSYRITFQYEVLSKDKKTRFVCGPCNTRDLAYPWYDFQEIKIKNILKRKEESRL